MVNRVQTAAKAGFKIFSQSAKAVAPKVKAGGDVFVRRNLSVSMQELALKLHDDAVLAKKEIENEIRALLPSDLKYSLTSRAKTPKSIEVRLNKGKTPKDLVATRVCADRPDEATMDFIVQRIVNKIRNGKLTVTHIENYHGEGIKPYFTDEQVKKIVVESKKKGHPAIEVKTGVDATKASGYTTTQLNFVHKNGMTSEFQVRGKLINTFAEFEHVLDEIRKGKTSKNVIHEPVLGNVLRLLLSKGAQDKITTHGYKFYRELEMGIKPAKPKDVPNQLLITEKLQQLADFVKGQQH